MELRVFPFITTVLLILLNFAEDSYELPGIVALILNISFFCFLRLWLPPHILTNLLLVFIFVYDCSLRFCHRIHQYYMIPLLPLTGHSCMQLKESIFQSILHTLLCARSSRLNERNLMMGFISLSMPAHLHLLCRNHVVIPTRKLGWMAAADWYWVKRSGTTCSSTCSEWTVSHIRSSLSWR